MEIRHRFSETTLCSFEVETIREAAEQGKANLYGADLRGADLYGADLRWADLRGADLRWADLYGANLFGANLYGANLYGANLYGANLYGANLRGADFDGEKISQNPIQIPIGLKYAAIITDGFMRLGCKRFTHAEWAAFDDDQISGMDDGALEFWTQWKAPLLAMCDAHRLSVGGSL